MSKSPKTFREALLFYRGNRDLAQDIVNGIQKMNKSEKDEFADEIRAAQTALKETRTATMTETQLQNIISEDLEKRSIKTMGGSRDGERLYATTKGGEKFVVLVVKVN